MAGTLLLLYPCEHLWRYASLCMGKLPLVQLTRNSIVAAALEILDSYGLPDMTMRRVSAHLGVAPGALYWHLANKQQLISAIADDILSPVLNSDAVLPPEELAHRLHSAMLARRDGAELVGAALSQPDSVARADVEKQLAQSLGNTHADSEVRRVGAASLLHLVLGSAALEQAQIQYVQATGADPGVKSADFDQGIHFLLRGISQESGIEGY